MCRIILKMNKIVTTDNTIFCGLWLVFWWQLSQLHGHSRITKSQDNPNINAENTKSHGSNHSGIKLDEWATSGANKLITDNMIGSTQQNKCGKIVAIIPILTALFFILFLFADAWKSWCPQQESNLHQRFRKPPFYPVELWGHIK